MFVVSWSVIVFVFGVTLYYILTKDNPKISGFERKAIKGLNPNVDHRLMRIVEKCVEPE